MNPSTKRRYVSTARTAGRDPSSARPPKPRIRVLIADDHGVVREGLVSMIQRNKADMTVVGEASSGREVVELWKAHKRIPSANRVCEERELRQRKSDFGLVILEFAFERKNMLWHLALACARQAKGLILGELGFAYENEEGETALRLDAEKVLSPAAVCGYRRTHC